MATSIDHAHYHNTVIIVLLIKTISIKCTHSNIGMANITTNMKHTSNLHQRDAHPITSTVQDNAVHDKAKFHNRNSS